MHTEKCTVSNKLLEIGNAIYNKSGTSYAMHAMNEMYLFSFERIDGVEVRFHRSA